MTKKIKLLAITHMYPNPAYPIAGIFIKNQFDYLSKDLDISVAMPYPWVPNISKKYESFATVPDKQVQDNNIAVYYPRFFFFPFLRNNEALLGWILRIERWFSYWGSKKVIRTLIEEQKPDLVQLHGGISESKIAQWIHKQYRIPIITMLHGDDIQRYAQMPALHSTAKETLQISSGVICKSKALQKAMNAVWSKTPSAIIPSGYNPKLFFKQDKRNCRKKLKLPLNKKIIVFVGHLGKRKGVTYLLDALAQLQTKDYHCVLIGDGLERETLEQQAKQLNLQDQVSFKGKMTVDHIPPYVNAADLLVLPSLSEGLPNVLAESLACATPIVATNVSGNPEIVTSDVGLLVPPKDANALGKTIDTALKKEWNEQTILKRAQQFSVTESVKKTLQFYKKVLSKQ